MSDLFQLVCDLFDCEDEIGMGKLGFVCEGQVPASKLFSWSDKMNIVAMVLNLEDGKLTVKHVIMPDGKQLDRDSL